LGHFKFLANELAAGLWGGAAEVAAGSAEVSPLRVAGISTNCRINRGLVKDKLYSSDRTFSLSSNFFFENNFVIFMTICIVLKILLLL